MKLMQGSKSNFTARIRICGSIRCCAKSHIAGGTCTFFQLHFGTLLDGFLKSKSLCNLQF